MEAEAFFVKAEESLASAEDDYESGRYNSCARGAYYAAFQAAIAALLAQGIRPRGRWEHEFVHAQFLGRLVYRRKLYPTFSRQLLVEAFDRRSEADYSDRMLGPRDVNRLLVGIGRLIGNVRERVHGNS